MKNMVDIGWLMVESLLEILTKRRSQVFYKPVDVHSVTNAIGEFTSSISNLEYCESIR